MLPNFSEIATCEALSPRQFVGISCKQVFLVRVDLLNEAGSLAGGETHGEPCGSRVDERVATGAQRSLQSFLRR